MLQNRYELLEEIGDGGTALVYKARCTLLDRIVAIKILKEEFARDQAYVRKFRSEAQAAARLSHPNIVNVYDVGEEDGSHYIVMEYVEGTTLKEYIEARAPLPPDEAIRIAALVCDALDQAHRKGIIHRDIKPRNILITGEGAVKVADFGIARAPTSSTITYSGNIMGSVHYISPEQARGATVDSRTDIYSVGCLLYEMLTGKVPFDAESPVTVALKHIHEDPVPPQVLNEAIPSTLEQVVLTAMAKDPNYRFSTAGEMKEALLGLRMPGRRAPAKMRDDKTIVIPSLPGEGDETELGKKKKKVRPMGIVVMMVALLGLLGGILYGIRGEIFGKEVVVPNIEGLSAKEAYNRLSEAGLKMTKIGEQYSSAVESDAVISQDPKPGEKVKEGREVRVILSKGPEMVRVPDLVGMSLDDARLELRNAGLRLGDKEEVYDEKTPQGEVLSQEPRAYRQVETGSRVDVVVSQGPKPNQIQVPRLTGMYLEEARSLLQQKRLALGNITRQDSSEYFPGQVISQVPEPDSMVGEGESVSVVVSKGPGPLPGTTSLNFRLPETEEYYQVLVMVNDVKGAREVYRNIHGSGEDVTVPVSYYGKATVDVYLNGQLYKKYAI